MARRRTGALEVFSTSSHCTYAPSSGETQTSRRQENAPARLIHCARPASNETVCRSQSGHSCWPLAKNVRVPPTSSTWTYSPSGRRSISPVQRLANTPPARKKPCPSVETSAVAFRPYSACISGQNSRVPRRAVWRCAASTRPGAAIARRARRRTGAAGFSSSKRDSACARGWAKNSRTSASAHKALVSAARIMPW